MKRTILVVLMSVVIVTPCFAQEIEPDGLFSIEGTRWGYCWLELGMNCRRVLCLPYVGGWCDDMAFYQGTGYSCRKDLSSCIIDPDLAYIDCGRGGTWRKFVVGTVDCDDKAAGLWIAQPEA